MAEVDRVVGNETRCAARRGATLARRSTAFLVSRRARDRRCDIMAVCEMAPHLLDGFKTGLPRVFLRCRRLRPPLHLCIIPYGRGNSRSVPMGAVVDQVRALVERGHARSC